MADYTGFLGLGKPAKTDRINVDVINDNMGKIEDFAERASIMLSETGKNISVSATGPYYTVTNNNADTVQVLLEGNSMLLDPGETFKMNKDATETFTLEVTCASDVTVAYFMCNKEYVDGSIASNLANYYDKSDSDSIFLKTLDFGNMRKEKSDSICTVDLPLKYNAVGNPVEEYRIHGDTSQPATPTPASPVIPIGTGDLVTDSESEHYNEYAIPIINNSIAYNVYLATPLYRVNDKSDYIDYARQKVFRNVGIITYDGSTDEAWENYEYQNYRIDLTNLGGGDNPGVSYEVLCDKLLKTSEDNLGIATNRIAICDGKVCVHFNSALTTVSEFKAYLQSNPITVYYPLASEVTEDVMLPELPTISGENQLYVDTTELPKNVVVGALMQYLTRKDMNDTPPGLDNYYTKSEVNTALSDKADSTTLTTHTGDNNIHVTAADKTAWNNKADSTALGNKVDKVTGKGLSTNDYTNAEKDNVASAYTHSQSAHAPSNAEENVQSDWNETENTSDAFIKNKPTSLPASDVSAWAKEPFKPTYSKSEIGLSNVPNVATNDQTPTYSEASTLATLTSGEKMSIAFGKIKKAITSLISHTGDISNPHSVTKSQVGLGNVDNTSDASKPVSTATQTALDTKASTTTLTTHTGNADIHVTAEDKTAWNMMPKSKSIDQILGINVYKDFVIPLIEVTSTTSNEYFCGKIFLKRTNGANDEITIINAMCGKRYNQEKTIYNIDASDVFTPIKPCVFTYNSKKYFGIHVNIPTSEYEIFRIDARTTTNYNDIKMIFIYDTNAKQVINSEIYNSLDFAALGTSVSTNFYAVPQIVDSNYVKRKLLYFSPVPATLTSSGTVGDIAYDTSYMYICTATNTWKKISLGTEHIDNTDIHVTSADKTAWNDALISKADTTTVNTALDLKANLTDLDEIDRKTVFIGEFEPTRTSALWLQNAVPIPETEFIDMPQTNFINSSTMSIVNQSDENYGILYVSVESNAKYRICKQAGHSFRVGTTTSIPQTGITVNYTTANHTGDQITITTGNTDEYLVIVYWHYTLDPETTKEQMRATITIDEIDGEIGNTQIHYFDNGNYLPLITSDTAIKSQPRNLIWKNILFIGDSITEKNYRTAKNYHDYLAEWFGFENINKGVSGTGYMDNETFGLGWYNKLLNGFYPSTGVDGIVIMGAINDRYHSVGTYGDSTTTTLFGTLKLMYEELITRYPKIPILIITSPPRSYSYGDSGNDGTLANYHGHVDAVIQMAKEYSFPCFDLYRNSGLRPWNTTNNTEYFTADGTGEETGPRDPDGVHPNSKGHKIIAQKLFEFINSGLNL